MANSVYISMNNTVFAIDKNGLLVAPSKQMADWEIKDFTDVNAYAGKTVKCMISTIVTHVMTNHKDKRFTIDEVIDNLSKSIKKRYDVKLGSKVLKGADVDKSMKIIRAIRSWENTYMKKLKK